MFTDSNSQHSKNVDFPKTNNLDGMQYQSESKSQQNSKFIWRCKEINQNRFEKE